MRTATSHPLQLDGRRIHVRVVRSTTARRLRVRVGPSGVELLQPASRSAEEVSAFLGRHEAWLSGQLERIEQLGRIRRPGRGAAATILFRGQPTLLRVETVPARSRRNAIAHAADELTIRPGVGSRTPVARSLESWLRRQARCEIHRHLSVVTERIGHVPRRVYVMGQRTKWGNCSKERNLSFNWRLILAPEFVLRYLVTHEAAHLAIPDHSAKFWLTVQSLCPETERAKQWLCRHHAELTVDLEHALSRACPADHA